MTSHNIANVLKIFFWGIVVVIATMVMLSFSRGENPFDTIDTDQGTLSVLHEQTINEDISSISLGWYIGGVTVTASNDDKIHLVERAYANVAESKWANVSVNGGTLKITSRNKSVFNFFFWHTPSTYLELRLPAKEYTSFALNLTSGENEVRDLSTLLFDVNSTSGTLTIKNLSTEKLELNMTSGQTTFTDAKTQEFDGVITSGNLRYDGVVDQRLDLTMTSGVFNTELRESAPQSIDFHMTSGVAHITLATPADFMLTLSKTSGLFTANFNHTQNGNKYTYKNGRDDYRFGMTSGALTIKTQD
ncbi:MAG: hypothetical protein E4G74_02300 [Erysipelotrichales bacterium]|nr:MAG: hypothetical protein E4G74_02300 [Erysipelotrichales bacterium]